MRVLYEELLLKDPLKDAQHLILDVIYIASNKEETNPGASGQVQDPQEHHRDDQEQLLDDFLKVFRRF